MYRRFIALVTAASLALTAIGAAPAQAGNDEDLAKALAVILGVAVVGKIIHDKKKEREQVVSRHQPAPVYTAPRPRPRHQESYGQPRPRHQNPYVQPRPLPRNVDRKLLPGNCFRSVDTRRGTYHVFGTTCLNQNYRHASRLPQQCFVDFRTRAGRETGYDARCLRDNGYSLARG